MKLALAARNLFRSRARSSFCILAIGFGVVAMLLGGGFTEWQFDALRESTIRAQLGHAQVSRPGYFERGAADSFRFVLPDRPDVIASIEALPRVKLVARRLGFAGLISLGETTTSFLGEGVVPEKEEALSDQLTILRGENLSAADPNGVILGEGLASSLGVELGRQVVILANTSSGGINAVEARVVGVFRTNSKAFDDVAIRAPLPLAERLLRVSGAHTWVVLLDETRRTDAVVPELRRILGASGEKLEVTPWYRLSDFYNKTVDLFSRQMTVVNAVIQLIVILSISATLGMSVAERTGEIGTIMAMGGTRRGVLGLFLTEGALLGIVGGLAGLLVGYLLSLAISAIGIPLPPPPGSNRPFLGKIFVTFAVAAGAVLLTLASAVLASVHPAWKASRLQIVDALRQNV